MIKKLITLLIIIAGIFFPAISYGLNGYHAVDDISFIEYGLDSVHIEKKGFNIAYKLFSSDSKISPEYIKYELSNSSMWLFAFLKSEQMQYIDCKPQLQINLYTIPIQSLNDGRFTDWQNQSVGESLVTHTVFGIYEPNTGMKNVIAILIATKQSKYDTKMLIGHEMSHYWYDRLCLNVLSKYKTEDFARKFERFFREKNAY